MRVKCPYQRPLLLKLIIRIRWKKGRNREYEERKRKEKEAQKNKVKKKKDKKQRTKKEKTRRKKGEKNNNKVKAVSWEQEEKQIFAMVTGIAPSHLRFFMTRHQTGVAGRNAIQRS